MAFECKDREVLSKLLEQLTDVYECCAVRKRQYEALCQQGRILFKPWPNQLPSSTPKCSLNKENKAEKADVETEKTPEQAVEVLEKAVARAQRTRDRLLLNMQKLSVDTDVLPINGKVTSADTSPSARHAESMKSKAADKPTLGRTVNTGVRTSSTIKRDSRAGTISQSKLNSLLRDGEKKTPPQRQRPDSRSGSSSTRRIASVGKTAGNASQRPESRVGSAAKHRPAHLTAPFKTDAAVARRRPRPGAKPSVCAKVPVASQKTASRTENTPEVGNANGNCSAADRTAFVAGWAVGLPDAGDGRGRTGGDGSEGDDSRAGPGGCREEERVAKGPPRAEGMPMQDEGRNEKKFSLRKNGGKPPMPKRLQKAAAINRRLRQKAQLVAMTTRVTQKMAAAECFLQRLQHHISDTSDSNVPIQRVCEHRDTYDFLLDKLTTLDANKIDEFSSWQRVSRCRTTLQFIFSKFADLSEEYQHLVHQMPCESSLPRSPPTSTDCTSTLTSIWAPQSSATTEFTEYSYHRREQLIRHATLTHEVQLLHLQSAILEEVKREMLPLVQQCSVTDPFFSTAFRATYSMLCCDGQQFPALINDDDGGESTTIS